MSKPTETSMKTQPAPTSEAEPSDPIAISFAQYKQFALLRCSEAGARTAPSTTPSTATVRIATTKPDASKQKASVSLANVTKSPDLILTKWIDSEGVVRTRNRLNDPTSGEFFSEMRTQRWA